MSNPTGDALAIRKVEQLMSFLRAAAKNRGMHGELAGKALEYIEELQARVDQLAAPAKRVIELAGGPDGVYMVALMNAYLKRIEGQTQAISKLNARVAELERQIDAQARRVE